MRKPQRIQLEFEDLSLIKIMQDEYFYRPLLDLVDFQQLMEPYRHIYSNLGRSSYPIETGIKCMLVQIFEDKSDREMELMIRFDLRIRFFCGFGLNEITPDHCYFGRFRERLGDENIEKIHNHIVDILRKNGMVGDIYSFIDTTQIVRKNNTCKERDKKIEEELKKKQMNTPLLNNEPLKKRFELKRTKGLLNNGNISMFSADPDARTGCKGDDKFWFGYKRGVNVDSRLGIITKVAVEPANLLDHQMVGQLFPPTGAVFMDKGFDVDEVYKNVPEDIILRIIKKNNRADKNRDFDRWISRCRSPFESVFSQLEKRTKYIGLRKNRFKGLIDAIAYNLAIVLRAKERYNDKFKKLSIA